MLHGLASDSAVGCRRREHLLVLRTARLMLLGIVLVARKEELVEVFVALSDLVIRNFKLLLLLYQLVIHRGELLLRN